MPSKCGSRGWKIVPALASCKIAFDQAEIFAHHRTTPAMATAFVLTVDICKADQPVGKTSRHSHVLQF